MRRPLLVVVLVLVAVVAWRAWTLLVAAKPTPAPEPLGEVADFALTERNGQTIHRDDLLGKVWVAGFAFTRCTGPCPQVTATMAGLQKEFAGQPDFCLVSVSVDPAHDTPEVLQRYADQFGADPARWFFLTGPRDDVYQLVTNSFRLGVQHNGDQANTGNQVTHSTRLALVDRQGRIRGYFEAARLTTRGSRRMEFQS